MRIPGLDDAMDRLDKFQQDMIPLLEKIADNTTIMTEKIEHLVEVFGLDEKNGED